MVDLKLAEEYSKTLADIEKLEKKKEELQEQLIAQMGTDPILTLDRRITKVITRVYPMKKTVTVAYVAEHFPEAIIKGEDSINKKLLEANPHARDLFETQPQERVHLRTSAL